MAAKMVVIDSSGVRKLQIYDYKSQVTLQQLHIPCLHTLCCSVKTKIRYTYEVIPSLESTTSYQWTEDKYTLYKTVI